MTARIVTNRIAGRLRQRIIRPDTREILITRLQGSAQERDITSPVNCGGLGRVRHFRRTAAPEWPQNFLPIDPAARALNIEVADIMEAEVFQNAACAWRCWYCYVPFELLGGHERNSEWVTADELVRRYAALPNRPPVLDLSGGSPDLTPEWVPWTLEALHKYGVADSTYLWSDDNLSTDFLFDTLSDAQRRMMVTPNYGRVCCFKGFDGESFAFNTGAEPTEFRRQFERFARYVDLGLDLYVYVTLAGPTAIALDEKIGGFIERLSALAPKLLTRTVPLRIELFGPTAERNARRDMSTAFAVQEAAIRVWNMKVQQGAVEVRI